MFNFLKKKPIKTKFDRKILRKNDISLLILDERWNSLFESFVKSPEIVKTEEQLKDLLKEQAKLIAEAKEIAKHKKMCLDKIMKLTTEVFDNKNESAKKEMSDCEKDINKVNERSKIIETEVENIPDRIRELNLELLEHTVNVVYFRMRESEKRVSELGILIEQERTKLKEYIDEKELLSKDHTDIYTYFHDLIGGEELEKLDKEHFL